MIPHDTAAPCLPSKSSARAPPRYEYGPSRQNAVTPIATSGSTGPTVLVRSSVSIHSATAVAARPQPRTAERLLGPRRSLNQPVASTDTAPTAGNTALALAAPLML